MTVYELTGANDPVLLTAETLCGPTLSSYEGLHPLLDDWIYIYYPDHKDRDEEVLIAAWHMERMLNLLK